METADACGDPSSMEGCVCVCGSMQIKDVCGGHACTTRNIELKICVIGYPRESFATPPPFPPPLSLLGEGMGKDRLRVFSLVA